MNEDDAHKLGGVAGGLLKIFDTIGTALVAIVVGWSVSKRVKLETRIPIGACVPAGCVGGIVGIFVPAHDRIDAVQLGVAGGLVVGLALSLLVIWLIEATSKE